jgi:choline monooxygenase
MRLDDPAVRSYEIDANWLLYVENYLEGFHIPFVHPSLARAVDFKSYATALYPRASVQVAQVQGAELQGDAPRLRAPAGHEDHGRAVAAYYAWLWPNTMLNVYPWGCSVNVVQPLGPARTRVVFLPFVADAALAGSGAGTGLDAVELEDETVVQRVQRGVRARLYERGRYSPSRETGVHHFHRLLAAALAV